MKLHYASLFSTFLTVSAVAQPGTLDPSFGIAGITILQPGVSHEHAYEVLALADTTLLVCGVTSQGGDNHAFIVHLRQDGSVDTGYGQSNGYTFFDAGEEAYAYDMELAPDGSVFICGTAYVTVAQQTVALYHVQADGNPDLAFGTNGFLSIPVGTGSADAQDLAIQDDGKIVLAGRTGSGSNANGLLLRYNPDGTPDNSFSGDGVLQLPTYPSAQDQFYAVDIHADGFIVVTGFANLIGDEKTILVKVDTNGVLDPTFGGDGVVVPGFPWTESQGWAIESDGQGFLVAGVDRDVSSNYNAYVARFNDDGSFDTAFGSNGFNTVDLAQNDHAYDIELQPDGKVLVCGTTGSLGIGAPRDYLLMRFKADGTLDPLFGNAGTVVTNLGNAWDDADGLAMQPDGKIVCAGFRAAQPNNDVSVVRYLNDLNTSSNDLVDAKPVGASPNPIDQGASVLISGFEMSTTLRCLDALGRDVLVPVVVTSQPFMLDSSILKPGSYVMVDGRGNSIRLMVR